MRFDELRQYALEIGHPFEVNVELTQKCNFRCGHCYCPDTKSGLTFDQASDIIHKCHKAGVLVVNFTGGEVTLRSDFPELYTLARELGCLVSIQSNLSHLGDALKISLAARKPKNISVTLYGSSDAEYETFTGAKRGLSKVLANLDFLRDNGINFNLKAVLTRQTRDAAMHGRFDEIARRYGKEISWDGVIFGRKDGDATSIANRLTPAEIVAFDRADEERRAFWDQKVAERGQQASIKCGGGISSFSVDSAGRASICSLYVSEKYDLLNNGFDEVWTELRRSAERMQAHYARSACSGCGKKLICRWCAAYAVLEHGVPDHPVPFMCELAEERVKQACPQRKAV